MNNDYNAFKLKMYCIDKNKEKKKKKNKMTFIADIIVMTSDL